MNFLVERTGPHLQASAIADVLDRLAWLLVEDDAAVLETVSDGWLAGQDRRRAEIALAREDAFPARNRDELIARMDLLASQHPDLQTSALRMIERWDRQFGQRT